MTVGAADIHAAVGALWSSGGLDTTFKSYWAVADRTVYPSITDTSMSKEVAPRSPFPFALFEASRLNISTRMSASAGKRHVHDQPFTIKIYAEESSTKTAKLVAAELAEEVMKVFGGHPTQVPSDMTMSNGNVLIVQYQSDYGEQGGESVYCWTIDYNVRVDVPVMV